jgi:hypothetical protein
MYIPFSYASCANLNRFVIDLCDPRLIVETHPTGQLIESHFLPCRRVPQLEMVVIAPADEHFTVRRECD